jgi:hypothetical protein
VVDAVVILSLGLVVILALVGEVVDDGGVVSVPCRVDAVDTVVVLSLGLVVLLALVVVVVDNGGVVVP